MSYFEETDVATTHDTQSRYEKSYFYSEEMCLETAKQDSWGKFKVVTEKVVLPSVIDFIAIVFEFCLEIKIRKLCGKMCLKSGACFFQSGGQLDHIRFPGCMSPFEYSRAPMLKEACTTDLATEIKECLFKLFEELEIDCVPSKLHNLVPDEDDDVFFESVSNLEIENEIVQKWVWILSQIYNKYISIQE